MSDKPRNIINGMTTTTQLMDMCEGHAEEENRLIAQLYGENRAPMSAAEAYAAQERLATIQQEMAMRDEAMERVSTPMWQGMNGR